MKSKNRIMGQLQKKRNPEVVQTVLAAKNLEGWYRIAEILSSSTRKIISVNLNEISDGAKKGDIIVVPGKVLSQGELDKEIKICAMKFSEKAKEKLLNVGVKPLSILEEIKLNPSGEGIKILEK